MVPAPGFGGSAERTATGEVVLPVPDVEVDGDGAGDTGGGANGGVVPTGEAASSTVAVAGTATVSGTATVDGLAGAAKVCTSAGAG